MLSIELDERQRLVEELKKSYDTQLAASQEILRLREEALDDMGLSSKEINTAFGVAHDTPYMLNISEDPMLSGCLLYYLKTNEDTTIGSADSSNIVLHGLAIPQQLCIISNINDKVLKLSVPASALEAGGRLIINGKAVGVGDPPHELKHLDRVVFGRAHMMRIMIPKLADTT
ncbi:kif1, putative, partial [Perkinsus marinus ATCC 50983]